MHTQASKAVIVLILLLSAGCGGQDAPEPEPAPPVPRSSSDDPVEAVREATGNEREASFGGVTFAYDEALGEEITGTTRSAIPVAEGPALGGGVPKHLRMNFRPDTSTDSGFNPRQPQLLVYPVDAYRALGAEVGLLIDAMRAIRRDQPQALEGELPLLPMTGATQVFVAQQKSLPFVNGSGLRFVTHLSQSADEVRQEDPFYTFQGLTEDEQYYVALFYPVTVETMPELEGDYGSYVARLTDAIDALPPRAFAPDLTLLDSLVRSLRVEPRDLGGTTPAVISDAAPVGTWNVRDYSFGATSAASREEAQSMLGQTARIEPNRIQFGGQSCRVSRYARETVDARSYLQEQYNTSPTAIDVPTENLSIITTDCDLPGFSEIIQLSDAQLVIPRNGVFYVLVAE